MLPIARGTRLTRAACCCARLGVASMEEEDDDLSVDIVVSDVPGKSARFVSASEVPESDSDSEAPTAPVEGEAGPFDLPVPVAAAAAAPLLPRRRDSRAEGAPVNAKAAIDTRACALLV